MSQRFFVEELPQAGQVTLSAEESHHLARVCRLRAGERIWLFDGRSPLAREALVNSPDSRAALVELTGTTSGDGDSDAVELEVASCVPKGERFDWMVEKLTEIGVSRLVLLRADHSVVAPGTGKVARARRTVISACKQCGRNRLMRIDEMIDWNTLISTRAGVRLVADRSGGPLGVVEDWGTKTQVTVAIGPEGGLTPEELVAAEASGWRTVRLGSTTLRVETAAIVAAAQVFGRVSS